MRAIHTLAEVIADLKLAHPTRVALAGKSAKRSGAATAAGGRR
jgi:hypothetical protein